MTRFVGTCYTCGPYKCRVFGRWLRGDMWKHQRGIRAKAQGR